MSVTEYQRYNPEKVPMLLQKAQPANYNQPPRMSAKGLSRSEFPEKINRSIYDQQVMFKVRAL